MWRSKKYLYLNICDDLCTFMFIYKQILRSFSYTFIMLINKFQYQIHFNRLNNYEDNKYM